jgi:hypothetical protein
LQRSGEQRDGQEANMAAEIHEHLEALRRLLAQARVMLPAGVHAQLFEEMSRTLEAEPPRPRR